MVPTGLSVSRVWGGFSLSIHSNIFTRRVMNGDMTLLLSMSTLFGPRGSHTQFVAVSPGHAPPLAAGFGHEAGLRGGLGSDGIAEDRRRLARLEGVEPG